ncbi:MAG TPA: (2Fe-2S)-binding protein [Paraburkholderia sp.]|jgi:predicted molibdopterin-dependent oxidoreductase YjgC|nr:(2Fe-2S)-binding protein [Paraburkholderia sp.]
MESLFRTDAAAAAPRVTIHFDGAPLSVPAGLTVAAALLASGARATRTTPVGAAPRAPYCMMGVCFECLVEIDGVASQQGCLTRVRDGMQVCSQHGVRTLDAAAQGLAR